MSDIVIIQDSKEKEPCNLTFYDGCKAQIIEHLETGDYTAQGYEDLVVVERKRSTAELAVNIGFKYKQFRDEFERMQDFPYRYLVCEFPEVHLDTFPKNSGIPRGRWKKLKIHSKFLRKRIEELCEEFDVEVFYSNSKEEAGRKIFELIYDAVNRHRAGASS